ADNEPARIEFVGDMVESIRRFDPVTQRSTGPTDQIEVIPVRERFEDDAALVPVMDFLAAARGVRVIVSEHEQVGEQARKVREQLESSYRDAAGRGHVVALPPDEAFVEVVDIAPRLDASRRSIRV